MTTEVERERLRAWVTALRSGDYEQNQGELRYADSFCCLGVACDVFAKANGEEWDKNRFTFHGEMGFLPAAVKLWYGLEDEDPLLKTRDGYSDLATALNDNNAYSFAEIADAIERTYLQ